MAAKTSKSPTSALNDRQSKTRISKAQKASLAMRQELWPQITDEQIWVRTQRNGYTTIPRTLPQFMEIINDASKHVTNGKAVPAGKSYLVLWCHVFDECIIRVDAEAMFAAEAGYSGERNVSTWREHLRVLKDLGFIDFKPGPAGPCQYILMLNPYHAVQILKTSKFVQELAYTSLLQRALDIGATDLQDQITNAGFNSAATV
jgi:hypothetical protein